MRENNSYSAAAVNKLSTGLISQTYKTALSGKREVRGQNEGREERMKERKSD